MMKISQKMKENENEVGSKEPKEIGEDHFDMSLRTKWMMAQTSAAARSSFS